MQNKLHFFKKPTFAVNVVNVLSCKKKRTEYYFGQIILFLKVNIRNKYVTELLEHKNGWSKWTLVWIYFKSWKEVSNFGVNE